MATIPFAYGLRGRSSAAAIMLALEPGELGIDLTNKALYARDYSNNRFQVSPFYASPDAAGAAADGVTHDGAAINAAIEAMFAMGGGTVRLSPGKIYAVDPGIDTILIRSYVTLDLNGSTIQRIGTNYENNLIQNHTYNPGTGYDTKVGVINGTIKGNGTSTVGTQSHSDPAGNVFFFGVNGFLLEDLKFDTSNGDNFGWRLSNYGHVNRVTGGSFGRNLFSPTSGIKNFVTNCNLDFAGLSGATPGAYIDAENDAANEVSEVYYDNVIAKGAVFVDFWTAEGGDFAHKAYFSNCIFTGDSPRTFSVQSSNPTVARGFQIGDTCRIAVAVNTAAALKITRVGGVQCNALLANDAGSQGTSIAIQIGGAGLAHNSATNGIFSLAGIAGSGSFATKTLTITDTVTAGSETVTWTSTTLVIAIEDGVSTVEEVLTAAESPTGTPWATLAAVSSDQLAVDALSITEMNALPEYSDVGTDGFEFKGRVAEDEFSTGLYAVDAPLKNGRFSGAFIGDVQLREGSEGNRFSQCKLGVLTIIDSGENEFNGTKITGATSITTNSGAVTEAVDNDFAGSSLEALTFSGAATLRNKFHSGTVINGTKTFNSSSTWLGQIFERQEGTFTPTGVGSSGGTLTFSDSWGRYNLNGDIVKVALSCTISGSTGTGDLRISLSGLPNGIIPADGASPSRWPANIYASGFTFTGSQLVGYISGGNNYVSLFGLANTGTVTAVPATITTGTIYLEVEFRVR